MCEICKNTKSIRRRDPTGAQVAPSSLFLLFTAKSHMTIVMSHECVCVRVHVAGALLRICCSLKICFFTEDLLIPEDLLFPWNSVALQMKDKQLWVPDAVAAGCMVCSRAFNLVIRRHHCRRCGACMCSWCSHMAVSDKVCMCVCNFCRLIFRCKRVFAYATPIL